MNVLGWGKRNLRIPELPDLPVILHQGSGGEGPCLRTHISPPSGSVSFQPIKAHFLPHRRCLALQSGHTPAAPASIPHPQTLPVSECTPGRVQSMPLIPFVRDKAA